MNTGHGHVTPRADGVKARCGGPGICKACSLELAASRTKSPEKLTETIRDLQDISDRIDQISAKYGL